MPIKRSLITVLLFVIVPVSHGEEENVGIQLKFNNPLKGIFGKLKKPMESCYMAEPIGGFNHTKKNVKLCTEEQLNVVREYMGTFEGAYTGTFDGKIKIEISDGGFIRGHGETGGNQYTLSGSSWFISTPLDDYLLVNVNSYDVKNRKRISFKGKIKQDGVLNADWVGVAKKGNPPRGSLSLNKTAPYKKRETTAKVEKPDKKEQPKPPPPIKQSDNTPLFEAARKGDSEKIRKLLHKGYDLTVVDKTGATPLCVALRHGHFQAAQMLLSFGSDMNHKDNEGKTPLHYAAIYNVEMIAGALVLGGVDVTVKDKAGKTARDWAIEKKNTGVQRMLDALADPKAHPMFGGK